MATRAILHDDIADLPGGCWFTAEQLARLALPGLPSDKRSLNRRIKNERWALRTDRAGNALARPGSGHGGPMEYHVVLLPAQARLALARMGLGEGEAAPEAAPPAEGSWRWYQEQTGKVRAEAERRLQVVNAFLLLTENGASKTAAAEAICAEHAVSRATVWNWLALIKGVKAEDRLPALAPRRKGGGAEAEINETIWQAFKSDFLRLSKPTLTSCYDRAVDMAKARGLPIPSERTMRRRLEREVHPQVMLLRRDGEEALRRSLPAQRRTVEQLHALELVNVDGHKFDVFVQLDDGTITRPMMVAIQDIYSRKFLAWRIGISENSGLVRLAFADLFSRFGIPKGCVLDNGRAFASKWITGGAKSRYRYKIKEEEPTGLLTGLGIKTHWALPYRGQSKPIERGFRDLCDTIARAPEMEGAYTGNTPLAKPENYRSRAVPIDAFIAHVEREMARHNAKIGRRTGIARGRSFDQVFAESYEAAPITKIVQPEQLRMALLAAEQVRVSKQDGLIHLFGNRYWHEELSRYHGTRVTVRFDPDDLHREIHVYDQDGPFLLTAQLEADTGFLDVAGAKASAKRNSDLRRQVREAVKAEQLLSAEALAAMRPGADHAPVPAPKIVKMLPRTHGNAALKMAPEPAHEKLRESRVFDAVDRFTRD